VADHADDRRHHGGVVLVSDLAGPAIVLVVLIALVAVRITGFVNVFNFMDGVTSSAPLWAANVKFKVTMWPPSMPGSSASITGLTFI
jgi:hypothetical protein